jgi:hypothetical protein
MKEKALHIDNFQHPSNFQCRQKSNFQCRQKSILNVDKMQNGGKETTTTVACSQSVVEAGLPDFSWCNVPKWGKNTK